MPVHMKSIRSGAIATGVCLAILTHTPAVFAQSNAKDSIDGALNSLGQALEAVANGVSKAVEGWAKALPTQLGFPDDKMYKRIDLQQEERILTYPASGVVAIHFGNHLQSQVKVTTANTDRVGVKVTVLSDPDEKRANELANALKVEFVDGNLSIASSYNFYRCAYSEVNGDLSIRGSCYYKVDVVVPQSSPIAVYAGSKLLHGTPAPLSVRQLVSKITAANSSEQRALVETFASARKTPLNARELSEILAVVTFESNRYSAFERLAPLLAREERAKFAEDLESLFTGNNSKKAYHLLLSL